MGEAKGEKVRDTIYDFFDNVNNNLDDTCFSTIPEPTGPLYDSRIQDHMLITRAPNQRVSIGGS